MTHDRAQDGLLPAGRGPAVHTRRWPSCRAPGNQGRQLQGQPTPQVRFPPLDRTEKSDNTSLQGSAPHLCVLARPQGTGAGAAAVLRRSVGLDLRYGLQPVPPRAACKHLLLTALSLARGVPAHSPALRCFQVPSSLRGLWRPHCLTPGPRDRGPVPFHAARQRSNSVPWPGPLPGKHCLLPPSAPGALAPRQSPLHPRQGSASPMGLPCTLSAENEARPLRVTLCLQYPPTLSPPRLPLGPPGPRQAERSLGPSSALSCHTPSSKRSSLHMWKPRSRPRGEKTKKEGVFIRLDCQSVLTGD